MTARAPIDILDPATGKVTRGNPGTSPKHKARMAALKVADPAERTRLLAEADKLSRAWGMTEPVTTKARQDNKTTEAEPYKTTEAEPFTPLTRAERNRRYQLAKKLIEK